MAFYGNLRVYRAGRSSEDIRGASIFDTNEEKLGEIAEVIFDTQTGDARYVVINTGGWLTSKKFVVPARHLMIREEADKDFHVALSKEQAEKLPEINEKALASEDGLAEYERQYEAALESPDTSEDSRSIA